MILICGATGQVGGEIVRLLLEAKQTVRVLTRDTKKAERFPAGVDVARGDFKEPDSLGKAFDGVGRAFVMAYAGPWMKTAMQNVVDAAKRARTKHVVFLSSYAVEELPKSAIARWHKEGEDVIAASSIASTILRPGNFASNALRWADTIRAQGSVFDASNGSKSAPIDPRDIAAVAAAALVDDKHAGKQYTLTGPSLHTVAEQVDVLARVLGRTIKHVPIPVAAARAGILKSGMDEMMADAVVELIVGNGERDRPLVTSSVRDVVGRDAHTFEAWARAHATHFA